MTERPGQFWLAKANNEDKDRRKWLGTCAKREKERQSGNQQQEDAEYDKIPCTESINPRSTRPTPQLSFCDLLLVSQMTSPKGRGRT